LSLLSPITVQMPPLHAHPTVVESALSKEDAKQQANALMLQVAELQALMIGAGTHRVLLVLQGLDASGKDGVVRFVMRQGDPLNCHVKAFKMPTPDELSHDFLWRVHAAVPAIGMMGIFNRSHYEDVIAAYVRGTITNSIRQQRFGDIRNFESLLLDHNTIIIKCFLHIDKDEQASRLVAREQQLDTAWKLSAEDWRDRQHFDDYLTAYDEAMRATHTPGAPWYVIPANRKWYRNLLIADLLYHHMQPFRQEWSEVLQMMQRDRMTAIRRVRAELEKE